MKISISNIALPSFQQSKYLGYLADLGVAGLEVAPSKVWSDTWEGLSFRKVEAFRREVNSYGLQIIGLHSLFFDHPDLGLFKGAEVNAKTRDFLTHLSSVCRDLGGHTLIYGGGRARGLINEEEAYRQAVDFLGSLAVELESKKLCICLEPLGPNDTDFVNSAIESLRIVRAIDSPGVRVQLDAKALIENREATLETFKAVSEELVHFHANEPGLITLGASGQIDHLALGLMLNQIGYSGFVSIEQKLQNVKSPMPDIEKSIQVLKSSYIFN